MEPPGQTRVERRLAAILAADVAGYSRLIEADEEGTLCRLKALRAEIVDPKIAGHRGRIVKTTGDGLLVEFASVVDAVRCAADLQAGLAERNAAFPDIAIEHIGTALRLSPRARAGWSHADLGAAYFITRRFEQAVSELRLVVQEDPSLPLGYRFLAACLAHMGRLDEAREIVTRLRGVTPQVIPDVSYLRNPEHRQLYLSGLRLAAGET
jgi:tetratricopeptide (TPR) repeat protein